ncbi:MAG: ATP-binding protein [Candidatus Obscuribacterales bacterium]|nr:ATP-binding protein [Candidatus Obscuribacterales bacterium]
MVETSSRIFERFQSSKDEGRNASGTGLGLPTSKAIIEQHGGTIGFDSEENKGSTFWFSVPCAPTA